MPYCSFKCEKECVEQICQNSSLAKEPTIEISAESLIDRFVENTISLAVVFGGLEPFDSKEDLMFFIDKFRDVSNADIVIYTGYTEDEVKDMFPWIYEFRNIIIKFGRFVPHQESHYDEVLGVKLASPNQYAKKIS